MRTRGVSSWWLWAALALFGCGDGPPVFDLPFDAEAPGDAGVDAESPADSGDRPVLDAGDASNE